MILLVIEVLRAGLEPTANCCVVLMLLYRNLYCEECLMETGFPRGSTVTLDPPPSGVAWLVGLSLPLRSPLGLDFIIILLRGAILLPES
jgi:hypothetical protein